MIYTIIILYILFLISKHERDVSRYNYTKSLTIKLCRIAIDIYLFFYVFMLNGASKEERKLYKIETSAEYITNCIVWFQKNSYKTDSWLMHNVLSFLTNGWKFWEAVNVASFCSMTVLILSTLYNIPLWGLIVLGVILYGVVGLIHSVLDDSLFRFKNKKE